MQQFNEPFRVLSPEEKAQQARDRQSVRAAGNPMENYPKPSPPAPVLQVSYRAALVALLVAFAAGLAVGLLL